jgi:hypothetical protein
VSEFLIVQKALMEEYRFLLDRLLTLHTEILEGATTLALPTATGVERGVPLTSPRPAPPWGTEVNSQMEATPWRTEMQRKDHVRSTPPWEQDNNSELTRVAGRYVIQRGVLSYADVVALEVPEDEFTPEEAWRRIEPLIYTRSSRAKESMRRALDLDDRFVKLRRDGIDLYRRKRAANNVYKDGLKSDEEETRLLVGRTEPDIDEQEEISSVERLPWEEIDDDDLF